MLPVNLFDAFSKSFPVETSTYMRVRNECDPKWFDILFRLHSILGLIHMYRKKISRAHVDDRDRDRQRCRQPERCFLFLIHEEKNDLEKDPEDHEVIDRDHENIRTDHADHRKDQHRYQGKDSRFLFLLRRSIFRRFSF